MCNEILLIDGVRKFFFLDCGSTISDADLRSSKSDSCLLLNCRIRRCIYCAHQDGQRLYPFCIYFLADFCLPCSGQFATHDGGNLFREWRLTYQRWYSLSDLDYMNVLPIFTTAQNTSVQVAPKSWQQMLPFRAFGAGFHRLHRRLLRFFFFARLSEWCGIAAPYGSLVVCTYDTTDINARNDFQTWNNIN